MTLRHFFSSIGDIVQYRFFLHLCQAGGNKRITFVLHISPVKRLIWKLHYIWVHSILSVQKEVLIVLGKSVEKTVFVGKQISLYSWQKLVLVSNQDNFFNKSCKRNESTHLCCLVGVVYQKAMNAISAQLSYFLFSSCIGRTYNNVAIIQQLLIYLFKLLPPTRHLFIDSHNLFLNFVDFFFFQSDSLSFAFIFHHLLDFLLDLFSLLSECHSPLFWPFLSLQQCDFTLMIKIARQDPLIDLISMKEHQNFWWVLFPTFSATEQFIGIFTCRCLRSRIDHNLVFLAYLSQHRFLILFDLHHLILGNSYEGSSFANSRRAVHQEDPLISFFDCSNNFFLENIKFLPSIKAFRGKEFTFINKGSIVILNVLSKIVGDYLLNERTIFAVGYSTVFSYVCDNWIHDNQKVFVASELSFFFFRGLRGFSIPLMWGYWRNQQVFQAIDSNILMFLFSNSAQIGIGGRLFKVLNLKGKSFCNDTGSSSRDELLLKRVRVIFVHCFQDDPFLFQAELSQHIFRGYFDINSILSLGFTYFLEVVVPRGCKIRSLHFQLKRFVILIVILVSGFEWAGHIVQIVVFVVISVGGVLKQEFFGQANIFIFILIAALAGGKSAQPFNFF